MKQFITKKDKYKQKANKVLARRRDCDKVSVCQRSESSTNSHQIPGLRS